MSLAERLAVGYQMLGIDLLFFLLFILFLVVLAVLLWRVGCRSGRRAPGKWLHWTASPLILALVWVPVGYVLDPLGESLAVRCAPLVAQSFFAALVIHRSPGWRWFTSSIVGLQFVVLWWAANVWHQYNLMRL